MNSEKSRSPEHIFADMHRELRRWNREIPESPERMDPVLRIIMQLFSGQLSTIDKKIEDVWKMASNSLIKAICPESMRWPIPAFTVMRVLPTDPVVEIDPQTRFFYKEEREGGKTFFFSPQRSEKLVAADVKYVLYKSGNILIDLSPRSMETTSTHTRVHTSVPAKDETEIYLAIKHNGPASDFAGATLFIKGNEEALKQLRWANWFPGDANGFFSEKGQFCPGLECSIEKMFTVGEKSVDWGSLRRSGDLFKPLETNFVILSESFISDWKTGPPESDMMNLAASNNINIQTDGEKLYWVRLMLPSGGDKTALQRPFEVYFNCFVAVNKNELTLFKHTGGNRLVEIEVPENLDNILEIINVSDSNGKIYYPRHEVFKDKEQKYYSLEERNGKLILWFDFSESIELPPDSITLNYAVTSSVEANGIEAGKITELYESHPGISEATNITPVTGAVPAKSEDQIITEVSARLRNRDRALSFFEIAEWVRTFDPRIVRAECRNGVERTEHGVRRCTIVEITIKSTQFYSENEIKLLKLRLESFLKNRSPVNSQFNVEVIKS